MSRAMSRNSVIVFVSNSAMFTLCRAKQPFGEKHALSPFCNQPVINLIDDPIGMCVGNVLVSATLIERLLDWFFHKLYRVTVVQVLFGKCQTICGVSNV